MVALFLLNTPTWVWPLLLGLVALGLRQTRTQQLGWVRAAGLPLALVGLAVGATQALAPALLQTTSVASTVAGLYALCSGVPLGRSLRLWRLAADTDAQWHHSPGAPRATASWRAT